MATNYKFQYLWRACGLIHEPSGINTSETLMVASLGVAHLPNPTESTPKPYSVHQCGNGRLGVSELIGAVPEQE